MPLRLVDMRESAPADVGVIARKTALYLVQRRQGQSLRRLFVMAACAPGLVCVRIPRSTLQTPVLGALSQPQLGLLEGEI